MKLDNNLCLKVLLDMCKIKYTDKQLVKLENLLSKLYILRTCSVDLGEVSQVSEEIPQNVEEISQNQGILLKGIVIWLVAARSILQRPFRALESNFSDTFSLFQLLQIMLAIHIHII